MTVMPQKSMPMAVDNKLLKSTETERPFRSYGISSNAGATNARTGAILTGGASIVNRRGIIGAVDTDIRANSSAVGSNRGISAISIITRISSGAGIVSSNNRIGDGDGDM